jgi:hypothetical protein
MKTTNLTLTLAVAAATLTSLALGAEEPFLSPRARANQVRTAPGVTEDRLQRGLLPGSPRGRAQKIREVSGTDTDPNLVNRNRNVATTPRALAAFPWLAQSAASRNEGQSPAPASTGK